MNTGTTTRGDFNSERDILSGCFISLWRRASQAATTISRSEFSVLVGTLSVLSHLRAGIARGSLSGRVS
jgi:hypothetical protein